jgi:phospholipid/cholesterol/gamma-HCH transport system substrate-binding protein
MIRPSVKLQLLVFAVITVLGVSYTAVRYVGLGSSMLGNRLKVYVNLADSGGIFSNADVTYRGQSIGRVGPLTLRPNGVRVELDLSGAQDAKIPSNTAAIVADRSAVGEQYVELEPRVSNQSGPYLRNGSVITQPNTQTPVSTEQLLSNVDALVRSVPTKDLGTVITEMNHAFYGTGPALGSLLDSMNKLNTTFNRIYPQTVGLLDSSKTVLDTQQAESAQIESLTANFASFQDSIVNDDSSIRSDMTGGLAAAQQITPLIHQLSPTLPLMLANFTTMGQVVTARIPGVRQALILYPLAIAGTFTVAPGDGTVHFGLEMNMNQPPACTKGYGGTNVRYPQDTTSQQPNTKASCKLPKNSQTDVRGSRNAPAPGPTPAVPPGAATAPGQAKSVPEGSVGSSGGNGSGSSGSSNNASGASSGGGSGGPLAPGGGSGSAGTGSATNGNQPLIAGYDPTTGIVYGPNGKQFVISSTGGEQRVLGDSSWEWLLVGSLTPK